MTDKRIAIVGHGGTGTRVNEFMSCLVKKERNIEVAENKSEKIIKPVNEFEYSTVNYSKLVDKTIPYEGFKEQRLYDLLNRLANVRYSKPVFRRCKSCKCLVVDYQLDKDDICDDCRRIINNV